MQLELSIKPNEIQRLTSKGVSIVITRLCSFVNKQKKFVRDVKQKEKN